MITISKAPDSPYPLGNVQLLGKLQAGMLAAAQPLMPKVVLQQLAHRSVDWWVMSEDLPSPNNRMMLGASGELQIHWQANNTRAHQRLLKAAKAMMREAGYPTQFSQTMGIETNSHQCGTLRFGEDPSQSVLNPWCQSHEVENLFVVDSSFFSLISCHEPCPDYCRPSAQNRGLSDR